MKFMDESGDDGKYVGSNSEFFTISIIDIENYVKVYNDLKRKLDKKNYFLKWYKLNDKQKDIFINSIKDVDYKVKIFYVKKSELGIFKSIYQDMCMYIFSRYASKDCFYYDGVHLKNMLERVRRHSNTKGINFKIAKDDKLFGIALADLWAGYMNYILKNNLKFPENPNIEIVEYIK